MAAVSIEPPSGTYGGVVEVNFTAAPGTTVISRVGDRPWQSGSCPLPVGVDAVVEYYGEAITGEIAPIQSASYDIVLPADEDSNRDGINDLLASALGLNIFGKGDTDGDSASDIEELLNGFDPRRPEYSGAQPEARHPISAIARDEFGSADPRQRRR